MKHFITTLLFAVTMIAAQAQCPPSSELSAKNVSTFWTTLKWTPTANATSYLVTKCKPLVNGCGTSVVSSPKDSVTLVYLLPSKTYTYYLYVNCSGDYAAIHYVLSDSVTFTTPTGNETNCDMVSNLSSHHGNSGTDEVTEIAEAFNRPYGAMDYTVRWKEVGANGAYKTKTNKRTKFMWNGTQYLQPGSPWFVLGNLTAGATYQWQMKTNCSDWTELHTFVAVPWQSQRDEVIAIDQNEPWAWYNSSRGFVLQRIDGLVTLTFYDVAGRALTSIDDASPGLYIAAGIYSDGSRETLKFIK